MIGLIGRKVGMTRLFGQDGKSIPVTAIVAGPCYVVQIKTDEKEGCRAVQLGAFDRRKKLVKKPQRGHFAKAGVEPKAKLAEFRVENTDLYHLGQELRVDIFQVGDRVKVAGTSKGRGFTGVVKRWGFAGGPKSHGQSDRHRAPGSIGGASWPSRVWKGMKMAGRMGSERVTVRNLEVVKVDPEHNILLLKGAVPGARNGYLAIQRTAELTSMPSPSGVVEEGAKAETRAEEKPQEAPGKKETPPGKPEEGAKVEAKAAEESQEAPAPQAAEPEAPSSSEAKAPEEVPLTHKEEAPEQEEAPPEKRLTGKRKGQVNG